MEFYKNILILVAVLLLAYFLSIQFGSFYTYFLPQKGGGFFGIPKDAENSLIGVPLAYVFFLTLLFTAFGGNKKYWWIGILLIPAAIFEIYFDLEHIYFPMIVGLAGWLLGLMVSRTRSKFIK